MGQALTPQVLLAHFVAQGLKVSAMSWDESTYQCESLAEAMLATQYFAEALGAIVSIVFDGCCWKVEARHSTQ